MSDEVRTDVQKVLKNTGFKIEATAKVDNLTGYLEELYNKSPTYEWVLFWEGVCKSDLFVSPTKLAYAPN